MGSDAEALRRAKRDLAEILSAFEFLDRASLDLVNAQLRGTKDPLPETPAPFYVVIETASCSVVGAARREGHESVRSIARHVT